METKNIITREFKVFGNLKCVFTPEQSTFFSTQAGLTVELWQKRPIKVIFLERGVTDINGNFQINFNIDESSAFFEHGQLSNVFIKVYYQGKLISGANPYTDESVSSDERPLKGYTLRIGSNNLGSLEIDVTQFEFPKVNDFVDENLNTPEQQWKIIFGAKFESGDPVPMGYRYDFSGRLNSIDNPLFQISQISVKEEYIQLLLPKLSVIEYSADEHSVEETGFILRLNIHGEMDNANEELFVKVEDDGNFYYSPVRSLILNENKLSIRSEDKYYALADEMDIRFEQAVFFLDTAGNLYAKNGDENEYVFITQIMFYQIENVEQLDIVSEGIYALSEETGEIIEGYLGELDTKFEKHSVTINNPTPVNILIDIKIFEPNGENPIYTTTKTGNPLSSDVVTLTLEGGLPILNNSGPTLEDVESVSNTTFSSTLTDFINTNNINGLILLKNAGPINYLKGIPNSGISETEKELLQAHVDLFTINENISENQDIILNGYNNLFDIANSPKDEFLNAVTNTVTSDNLTFYKAAEIHEVIVQNQKLVSNLLAARMTDYQLGEPVFPDLEKSNFAEREFASIINKCDCDDCQSGVSPFAYFVDLVKYGARHIRKTGSNPYYPVNYNSFFSLLENYFIQPFGNLSIDCDTLHDEFCRVRLVTEVLETHVEQLSLPQPVVDKLEDTRKKYLLLTYRTILEQAGTSYEELRDIVKTQPLVDKMDKAEKWSSKIGIPLTVTGTSELTADRIWLTFDNSNPVYELDGENLELIFGFRDTQRDVLTTPPTSLMDEWQQIHLKDLWRKADYPFTSYSRENVDPTANNSIKDNWLPIIDPDIIGRSDLTYLSLGFAKELLKHRKKETDEFLKLYIKDASFLERTSVDMNHKILRVEGRDITTHVIENDEIFIEETSSNFTNFNLLNRELVGLNTNVILKKSTPGNPLETAIFQPYGNNPVMQYNRVLNVGGADISIDENGSIIVTIDFNNQPLFQDVLSGGLLKLVSDNSPKVYTNKNWENDYELSVINFISTSKVSFKIDQINSVFFDGELEVVYEVEVPLFTALIPSPEVICHELFTVEQSYSYMPPIPAGESNPFNYNVWDEPTQWPAGINGSSLYDKLKDLYQIINSGTAIDEHRNFINNNLHLETSSFIKMMEILIACENYLNSMFTAVAPTTIELYGLTSIFRISAKHQLRKVWIIEEIKHDPAGGTNYIELMLDGKYFWKALNEPQSGVWNPTLQTIPESAAIIDKSHIPILDPEILKVEDLLTSPDSKPYQDLYNDRKDILETQRTEYFSWLIETPFNVDGFEEILNHINTGDKNVDFTLPDYISIGDLIKDFESSNIFEVNKAETNLWEAFGITGADFGIILPIKLAYEANDPTKTPSAKELKTAVELLTSGYKRMQLYGDSSGGWIEEEVDGTFTNGVQVKYYNVLKMRMPAYRGGFNNRSEWQRTLKDWNRVPTVHPDIVPPENINNFVNGAVIHDIWVIRKDNIDTLRNDIITLFNESITPDSDLLDNYELLIAMAIARTDDDTINVATYLKYFLNLEALENAGEDIRPYLKLYGINISAYRVLQNVYHIIKTAVDNSQPIDLLDSEYNDVVDILVAVHSQNIMPFTALQEEFSEDIILSGDDFKNYKPRPIEFPNVNLDEFNKWRSPHSLRKTWKDKLEARIDRKVKIKEEWTTALVDSEEITMPMMRDALIEALRNNCESFEAASERLAKRFYIETKDNCCVKHSRVSFALETIQGFIFSLESGIYDDELNDFSLSAPNFKKEWEWLGSYATWRSAVFTYIFPENLLYPTLKRLQSPQFRELSQTIQNANRFSSNDACKTAKKYQDYFEDLQHLKIICTTNAKAYFYNKDPFDCCEEINTSQQRYTTFYFAHSIISGKNYWSEKPFYYSDESQHSFWNELPIEKNKDVLGCYPLASEYSNNQPSNLALWVFYTYKAEEKTILAYIKKDLMTAGSNWSEEIEIGLADTINTKNLINILACQQSESWSWPSFILSYKNKVNELSHKHVHYNFIDDEELDEDWITSMVFLKNQLPLTAVKHNLNPLPTNGGSNEKGITVMFEDEIHTGYFGSLNEPEIIIQPKGINFDKFIGCYHKDLLNNNIVILEKYKSGVIDSIDLSFNIVNGKIVVSPNDLTNETFIQNISKVAPLFKQSQFLLGEFAVEAYSNKLLVGTKLNVKNNELTTADKFGLTIENDSQVPIQSGDCIDDFDLRTQNIKNHLRANLNPPLGNPIGDFIRTDKTKAYLYEAYYFVPMLIALDQQKRGQYEEALAWYRSVYDYTNNINSKRRVFYGLKLEQSIANVYQRPADWLLDPLNPHSIAETRANAYTKYTLMNIIQCMIAYADREFTLDTIETVPRARKLYAEALALMKTSALNKKPSACTTITHACLDQDVLLPSDGYWDNSFRLLQSKLLKYNDVETIDNVANAIKSIFENTTLDMEEKFSSAFEHIDNNAPAPETPATTSSLMNGLADQMNNASRFLVAGIDIHSFNTAVKTKVGTTVGGLSKLEPEVLGMSESLENISWLNQPEKTNAAPFKFEFTDSNGKQNLTDEYAYNPLMPYKPAYQANLMYTNANELYRKNIYRDSFTPIIHYRFCLPENPVYESFHLKANLELYKIHNCRNIAGMVRELDIFAAPTDSTTGVPMIGANGNLILPGIGNYTPSQYRFRVLIERAKQLVSQAQQLESQFLATLEKEDAERYSLMKARQDLQTAKSTVKLQDLRVKQANNELDLAELQLDKVEFSFDHFEGLIDAGNIGFEIASFNLLLAAAASQAVASGLAFASASAATDSGSGGTSLIASSFATTSSIMAQLASYQRRTEEWKYQKELANFDIQLSNQQIKIAEDNIRIVSQERKISEMNTGHAEDSLEFLKTKFTNAELYRWMGNILERTYSYMLSLATAVARTAERQYYFEQQEQAGPFILDDYWEVQETGAPLQGGGTDRRGMTGSVRLLQDITRLDQFAFDSTKRKLQITKTISLAQLFPEEFQSFRETGVLNFQLTNRMFDYDFPGQYLRLISGLKLGVIGLTPVYGGIKAMLTSGSTSYTVIEANNTFQRVPIKRLENEEIALSSPLSNNGLFELQPMQGQEMLNPFEGMGVESQWEFKMPKFSNRMDYSQIADVIVTLDYTALDNFQYRYQVLQDLDNQFGFNRGFSFKNDFPDQWYELAEAQDGTDLFGVEFEIRKDSFPQSLDNIQLDGSDLLLHFVRDDGFTDEIAIADFSLASADPETEMEGDTLNGTFRAVELTNVLNGNGTPFVRLRLYFDNTLINRELFSEEKVEDIMLLMSCRAELPNYPL